jgi:hypothetical protein
MGVSLTVFYLPKAWEMLEIFGEDLMRSGLPESGHVSFFQF